MSDVPSIADASRFLASIGTDTKIVKAPPHFGTAVFLDEGGRQVVSALFLNGKQFAWKTEHGTFETPS